MRPLCVLFLQFLVKSIVISKLKVKKQKLLRHPVPGYLLGFGPCDLAFQERGGSVHLWEGWLLGSMEPTHGTKLTPAGKVRSEGDVDLRENGSFGNPRSTTGKKLSKSMDGPLQPGPAPSEIPVWFKKSSARQHFLTRPAAPSSSLQSACKK